MEHGSANNGSLRWPMWQRSWSIVRAQLTRPGPHWVWLSIATYVTACFLPAMPPIWGDPVYGWVCLTWLIYTIPAWWANPAYFLSLILYVCRRHRAATVVSVIATLLAVSFELMNIGDPGEIHQIAAQEIGCYVWIISMQVLACNLLWEEWLDWKRRQEMSEQGQFVSA